MLGVLVGFFVRRAKLAVEARDKDAAAYVSYLGIADVAPVLMDSCIRCALDGEHRWLCGSFANAM